MKMPIKRILVYITIIVFAAMFIIPFLWIISTSLKGEEQIFAIPPQWIPQQLHWDNYA